MADEPPNCELASGETQQFERQLPENSMEYMIFILDDAAGGVKYLNRLESISKEATRLMDSIAKDYIWQRDEFRLSVVNEQGTIHLHGTTDYGDAVEDEWLIVYLLRVLSKAHPDIFIRVADQDGEFLLVEAANVLPNWLNPEVDHCRVWLQGGKLKLIPLHSEKAKPTAPKSLTLADAIKYLRTESENLMHSQSVEDEAFYRLEKYPEHVDASLHYRVVTIPRKLAYIIHELPKTVSGAVEAFYLRDHAGMKKITSELEGLHLPPTDLVTVSVKFSRVLFAQLRSQRFEAPRRWQSTMRGHSAHETTEEMPRESVLTLEDGMKLTCGYEMLAMTAENSKSRTIRGLAILLQDLKEDGNEELPTNADIKSWLDVKRNDDESWLDINYEDFERELEGKTARSDSRNTESSAFGDTRAQEDLRKIVSRFEAFMNNETAGLDGADIDEMDMDNDETDDETDENSDMEDKEVGFDEQTFSRAMKELMGLPTDHLALASTGHCNSKAAEQNTDAQNSNAEEQDIENLSLQMEDELKSHGALRLDRFKSQQGKFGNRREPRNKPKAKQKEIVNEAETREKDDEEDENSDGEVDVDYNLAKNLLESFKSQGGMAGPTGNLLGLMGIQLPRDEDDDETKG
ncbi:hypothetical protein LLEC1_02717 [Akanthomyces lecanii]|uniref:Uncharacterized protein n=1 Tax=Cordyceps confragosa TaxID=2714763 RepID=A0A179IF84_CORDF|nr:hypothetical protein LLEC1_02717 [Akanthomyces lecanii]